MRDRTTRHEEGRAPVPIHTLRSRWRYLAVAPALAMVIAGVATGGASGGAAAAPARRGLRRRRRSPTSTTSRPRWTRPPDGKVTQKSIDEAKAYDRKFTSGNPVAARQLARAEQKALKTGNPARSSRRQGAQTAKLLTILVEFDDQANDDWSGVMVPTVGVRQPHLRAGEPTVPSRAAAQQDPRPRRLAGQDGRRDNNSFWVPDFSPEHFDTMLYTDEGITERVRPDLTGPDGQPGIDISGYTMKNMYEEMSKGAYTVTGAGHRLDQGRRTPRPTTARTRCLRRHGVGAGDIQDMNGHPDNPLGAGQLAIDAVNALAAGAARLPVGRLRHRGPGRRRRRRRLLEPDGVIDHVVLVHAGEDKSGGGGAEGTYAIWAHSSAVTGGHQVPGTGR